MNSNVVDISYNWIKSRIVDGHRIYRGNKFAGTGYREERNAAPT
jgi:hypothetical protein